MSIVTVHGPYTFGSRAIVEVGAAVGTVNPANGLAWTFRTDQPSTRTASLAWTFPTGTPASATGPGPHAVTFAGAGSKAVTMVATGAGEGVNPYPVAGTTNLPVNAVAGAGPPGTSLLMAPGGGDEGEPEPEGGFEPEESSPEVPIAFDPAAHTVAEVEEYADEHPEQSQELLDAEVAGKNRTTLVSFLEGMLPYIPGDHSVTEVIGYVEDNPEELEDVLAAERDGKSRVTLINHLEGMREA